MYICVYIKFLKLSASLKEDYEISMMSVALFDICYLTLILQ